MSFLFILFLSVNSIKKSNHSRMYYTVSYATDFSIESIKTYANFLLRFVSYYMHNNSLAASLTMWSLTVELTAVPGQLRNVAELTRQVQDTS